MEQIFKICFSKLKSEPLFRNVETTAWFVRFILHKLYIVRFTVVGICKLETYFFIAIDHYRIISY